mmetsp:Transcript_62336/g.136204  ORF Transcript_62336/g.136204 Transcript_62336/m.136204 type:complete len:82 (-) Transcript_62336:324-569(-)
MFSTAQNRCQDAMQAFRLIYCCTVLTCLVAWKPLQQPSLYRVPRVAPTSVEANLHVSFSLQMCACMHTSRASNLSGRLPCR